MFNKRIKQVKGLPENRGALCPHDWLPFTLSTTVNLSEEQL